MKQRHADKIGLFLQKNRVQKVELLKNVFRKIKYMFNIGKWFGKFGHL